MVYKTVAAFLSPHQGFLESLLETSVHEMFPFFFLLYLEVYWTPLCCNMARMGLYSPLCQLDESMQTAWTAMCKETNGMLPSWAICTAPNAWGDGLGSFDAINLKVLLQAARSPTLHGGLTKILSFICNVQQALGNKGQDMSLVEVMEGLAHSDLGRTSAYQASGRSLKSPEAAEGMCLSTCSSSDYSQAFCRDLGLDGPVLSLALQPLHPSKSACFDACF